jgi:hypothetical protein
MVNDCIRVGLKSEGENYSTPTKRLSLLCYGQLKKYKIYSAYRLTAISKAAGILSARKKSMKRGFFAKSPVSPNGFSCPATNSRFRMASQEFS